MVLDTRTIATAAEKLEGRGCRKRIPTCHYSDQAF